VRAVLDPQLRPSVLENRAFGARGGPTALLALEQPDGSDFHFRMNLSPDQQANRAHLLRLARFALWSRGGYIPDEKEKRHGQAIAAASLPAPR
jgi:hypothetical protein